MSVSVTIPESVLTAIEYDASQTEEEICGVIIRGKHKPIHNIAKNPRTRFRMQPSEQMAAWTAWERKGELIVYHSHPRGSAYPSADDRWVIARSPEVVFLIYAVGSRRFHAYRYNGTDIIGIEVKRGQESTQQDQGGTVTNGPS